MQSKSQLTKVSTCNVVGGSRQVIGKEKKKCMSAWSQPIEGMLWQIMILPKSCDEGSDQQAKLRLDSASNLLDYAARRRPTELTTGVIITSDEEGIWYLVAGRQAGMQRAPPWPPPASSKKASALAPLFPLLSGRRGIHEHVQPACCITYCT